MNSKMTTNSQLSTNEPKKKKERKTMKTKTKQTTRTGTELEKWTSITWRDFNGEGEGKSRGENVQGRRSIIGRHKIDRKRPKIIQETENSKKLHDNPWT